MLQIENVNYRYAFSGLNDKWAEKNPRLENFLDRHTLCYDKGLVPKLEIEQPKRNYITYFPSAEIVEKYRQEFNRAIGSRLFGWMSGLTLSEEEASRSVEDALYGALSGLADILRKNRKIGEKIALDDLLRDLLIGGIATRLGRVPIPEASRIAECILEDLENILKTSQLHVDGAFVYVDNETFYIGLTNPVTMNDIIANKDDWEMRPVRL